MSKTIMRADVTEVSIGLVSLEGLMGEDGEFYVAVPQITSQFQIDKNQASRTLKALMQAGFQFDKLKTKFNPKAVNVVTLKDFEILVAKLDRAGNKLAQQFRDDMVGLSLHQLFSDAFGRKFEAADRQAWLQCRQQGKQVRRTLTDAIKGYIENHPELSPNAVKFLYVNASDAVNRAVFARSSKKLCQDLQIDPKDLRDRLSRDELRWLEQVEDVATRLIDMMGLEPIDAIKKAQERLVLPCAK